MKRNTLSILCGAALAAFAAGAQAGLAEFKADVNAAIDAGLAYSRANNHFTVYTEANGLSLLTLLEKESIPAGYNGLDAADKTLAQNAACILIDGAGFGDRGGFYSYYDGQVMMGLSVYLDTGGPDTPAAPAGYNCAGRSARATIDKVVDRTLASQSSGNPLAGSCAGFWGYNVPGCDSSTTQLTLAGLASAKGFYSSMGESLDKNRIGLITTALNLTSDGYKANAKLQGTDAQFAVADCGSGCYGHGYQVNGYGPSSQQTASGTWGQLVGAGKNINDSGIQGYLRWARSAYNYNTNYFNQGWAAGLLLLPLVLLQGLQHHSERGGGANRWQHRSGRHGHLARRRWTAGQSRSGHRHASAGARCRRGGLLQRCAEGLVLRLCLPADVAAERGRLLR